VLESGGSNTEARVGGGDGRRGSDTLAVWNDVGVAVPAREVTDDIGDAENCPVPRRRGAKALNTILLCGRRCPERQVVYHAF